MSVDLMLFPGYSHVISRIYENAHTQIPDIIGKYNLQSKMNSTEYVYIKIKKGTYGLKQAAVLAYDNLVRSMLLSHLLLECRNMTPSLLRLCVDDFGIKYYDKSDANHFLRALNQTYSTSVRRFGGVVRY